MRRSGSVLGLMYLCMLLLGTGLVYGQCAGPIVAWGYCSDSQCDVPEPNANFVAVAAGHFHSLGVKSDGTIVAWGSNMYGQCDVPEPNADFVAVAAGASYGLGLKSNGTIAAWGYNWFGQCDVPEPNADFVAVAAGVAMSLGLKSNGTIVAWGGNLDGQCDVPEPNANFVAVTGGHAHSLGLKSYGTIVAWGWNDDGQCDVPEPNADFVAVAGGCFHSLGLKSDGTIVAWGDNGFGQCDVPEPNAEFIAIAGCSHFNLGIKCTYALAACVDIDPDVLNPRSGGRWITAYIELPEGYDPEQIDISTVLLNETVPAEAEPTSVGDHDEDGIPDRTVKFSRPAVIDILPNGEHVEVCVSGEVAEHSFEGCDTIRVLMPKVTYPNGGEILEARQQCIITWELPAGYEAEWSSVYYTADDAESWNLIDDRVEGTSCMWIVPDVASDCCRVLIEAYDAQGVMGYDMSDQVFTVSAEAGTPREAIPISFALYPANPNPFTQGTVVSFDLRDSRHVKLTIHDVRGRLVKELIDEVRPAKSQSVRWDGKDGFGVDVPVGIYFVHLEAGDYEATSKIVLVR